MRALSLAVALAALAASCRQLPLERQEHEDPYDSGGRLIAEQASYDVLRYELALEVFPEKRAIEGAVTVRARAGAPLSRLVLDLDPRLEARKAEWVTKGGAAPLDLERRGPRLWIRLPGTVQPQEEFSVRVAYGGAPREAPNAPWSGGVVWKTTPEGQPWIATACQGEGADVWWPCKDHVSDKPETMDIRVTVPEPLVAAANGKLAGVETHGDGRRTYHWTVSAPISAYNVALNIAPYRTIEGSLESVAGGSFPVVFYVLPGDYERGRELFPEILEHLRFYEELLGPYPFRADKYGVAQTPHLGMEHQTIIGYGAGFRRDVMTPRGDWGFDRLHHHELSHEWWGNLVTNADWSDMWLHEGFGTYMQALYIEKKQDAARSRDYLAAMRKRIDNRQPVAPPGPLSAKGIYWGDIYFKGAWVLHTLRFLMGDDAFFQALRRMAYPTPDLERAAGGASCRFASTEDFVAIAERCAGRDIGWFFDLYVRQEKLPRLAAERRAGALELRWETPSAMRFPMPIEVRIGDATRRIEMPDGRAAVAVPEGTEPVIDPQAWVLRQGD
jgi:aminopeptidase N